MRVAVRNDRHLLLLVKTPVAKDRFLCGHDEREWFVAAVPGGLADALAGVESVIDSATQPTPDQDAATEFFTTEIARSASPLSRAAIRCSVSSSSPRCAATTRRWTWKGAPTVTGPGRRCRGTARRAAASPVPA